jgi:pyrimidine-nucleoside phosphorylase
MLVLGKVAGSRAEGWALAERALADGRALERMRLIVEAQGGNPAVLDDPVLLPQAPLRRVLEVDRVGYVTAVDARAIGEVAVALGAGRAALGAAIDPAVGFHITAKPGDRVEAGDALATVYARDLEGAERALAVLRRAIRIGEEQATTLPLISHRVTRDGVEEYAAAAYTPA